MMGLWLAEEAKAATFDTAAGQSDACRSHARLATVRVERLAYQRIMQRALSLTKHSARIVDHAPRGWFQAFFRAARSVATKRAGWSDMRPSTPRRRRASISVVSFTVQTCTASPSAWASRSRRASTTFKPR